MIVLACIVILLGHEFQTTSCTYLHIEQYNPASYLSNSTFPRHHLGIIYRDSLDLIPQFVTYDIRLSFRLRY